MVFKHKFVTDQRKDLSKEIPISTPYVVLIEPANICNFSCIFCPTGDPELQKRKKSKRGLIDFELFKKIVNDLRGFNEKIKCIKLLKEGEPLLNPKLPDMINYIKDANITDKIEVTTNGYLLNHSLSKKIINAGLNRLIISLEGLSAEDYKKNARIDIDFNKFIDQIKYFFDNRQQCQIHIKLIDLNQSGNFKQKFHEIFKNSANELSIEKAVQTWPGLCFNVDSQKELNMFGEKYISKDVCPLPFYCLCININGKIGVCCNEWEEKIIVGDAIKDNIVDVWNGDLLHSFQCLQLEKRRKTHPACGSCFVPCYGTVDNLDNDSEFLLSKIKKEFHKNR